MVRLRKRAARLQLSGQRDHRRADDDARDCAAGRAARRHPAGRHPARVVSRSGGIPLGGIPVGTPLGGIPLGGIDLTGTPLGGIPLGGINMSVSPLGGIPLGGIPLSAKDVILNCPTGTFVCADTDTLGGHGAQATRARSRPNAQRWRISATTRTRAARTSRSPSSSWACRPTRRSRISWPPSSCRRPTTGRRCRSQTFPLQDFSDDGGNADYTVSFTVEARAATRSTARSASISRRRRATSRTRPSSWEGTACSRRADAQTWTRTSSPGR